MMNSTQPTRTVHATDAIAWLQAHPVQPGTSLIASLPDFSEFPGLSLAEWKTWFTDTARLILSKTPEAGVTLFFQSDIKFEGEWVNKAYLVSKAADQLGHATLFHKIFCRAAPGNTTFGKPAYSHLLAFSKSVRPDVSRSTPDVLESLGDKVWVRGMGFEACKVALEFVRTETQTHTIINPFCGQGSILAVANSLGFHAVGIEKSPKRAEHARKLQVDSKARGFSENSEESESGAC